jgi:hypothetical protein
VWIARLNGETGEDQPTQYVAVKVKTDKPHAKNVSNDDFDEELK